MSTRLTVEIDLTEDGLRRIEGSLGVGDSSSAVVIRALTREIRKLRLNGAAHINPKLVEEFASAAREAQSLEAGYLANGGDKRWRPPEFIHARMMRLAAAETIAFDLCKSKGIKL